MRRARGSAAAMLALAVLALASCGGGSPSPGSLLRAAARAMVSSSYRLDGSDRAGAATVRFSVRARPGGDFSGQVKFEVPPSPVLSTQVVAVGRRVYVLSPGALAQLGITSLPGHLSPATTWVLQPASVGGHYRQSVAPFIGGGLGRTLARVLKGKPEVRAARFAGTRCWLLLERPKNGPSLTIYLQRSTDRLLLLRVSGANGFQLRYSDFNRTAPVQPPPSGQVYVPPPPAPGG